MRSKAPLVLMEQIVMVLVFALTAALCLQMFVLSGVLSRKYADTDRAVLEAQNAAEWLKQGEHESYFETMHAVGAEDVRMILFDGDWNVTEYIEKAEYFLQIIYMENAEENLWEAEILVFAGEEELFRIPVAGQKSEVDVNAEE